MNEPAVKHSLRFRLVANRYPLTVTYAYDGDIEAAAKDDDATVAKRVREWEISEGIEPCNWFAIGREEGRGDPTNGEPDGFAASQETGLEAGRERSAVGIGKKGTRPRDLSVRSGRLGGTPGAARPRHNARQRRANGQKHSALGRSGMRVKLHPRYLVLLVTHSFRRGSRLAGCFQRIILCGASSGLRTVDPCFRSVPREGAGCSSTGTIAPRSRVWCSREGIVEEIANRRGEPVKSLIRHSALCN